MYLAFGISAFVFSIISIFIPVFGVFIAGISGLLAWISVDKGLPFGIAAVIINFINLIFLSPAFIGFAGIESALKNSNGPSLKSVWLIVLFIQISAVIVFLVNFLIEIFLNKDKALYSGRRGHNFIEVRHVQVFLVVILLALSIILFRSDISSKLSNGNKNISAKNLEYRKNGENIKQPIVAEKNYIFSKNQVETAKDKIRNATKLEVEFQSGKHIVVDSAVSNNGIVTLSNNEGLTFLIHQSEIKQVRKIDLDAQKR
jgi:hypothetical protein